MNIATIKRHILPVSVSLFSAPGLSQLPRLMERSGAALQSKCGGGTGVLQREVDAAARFIPDRDAVVFDVGANSGCWTEELMRIRGSVASITMFEPQPCCWPTLERKTGGKIRLEKLALGDVDGPIEFWTNENSEIASVHRRSDFDTTETAITAHSVTLDRYLGQNGFGLVDFIKVDIEGHETQLLRGAAMAIAERKIGAISFEFGMANVNSRTFFIDFWTIFTAVGWKIYRIKHNSTIEPIREYSRSLEYFDGVSNYIASWRDV